MSIGVYKDFTNSVVNNIKIIERIGTSESGASVWACECFCGFKFSSYGSNINLNKINCKNCKIKNKPIDINKYQIKNVNKKQNVENFEGRKINTFIVKDRVKNKGTDRHTYWLCECENCGNKIIRSNTRLKKGTPKCAICKEKNRKKPFKARMEKRDQNEIALNICFGRHEKTSIKRKLEFTLSKEKFKDIIKNNCFYCGDSPSNCQKSAKGGIFIYNGIDRIDNNKGYIEDNCVPCCIKCNYMKHVNSLEDFTKRVEKIYNNIIKNNNAL